MESGLRLIPPSNGRAHHVAYLALCWNRRVKGEFASPLGGALPSDGRFIAQICPEVVELGPPGESIHKVDEYVAVAEVESLKNI